MDYPYFLPILKAGYVLFSVGLIYFTYRVLHNGLKKTLTKSRYLMYLTLTIGLIIVMSILFFTTNQSHSNVLEITFNGNTIELINPNSKPENVKSDEYYKNSDIGFSLLKPAKNWTRIKRGSGLIDFLKMSGLKENEITPEKLAEYNNDSFMSIFNFVTFFSFNQKKQNFEIRFTDSTEIEYLKPYEKTYYDQTLEALNLEYSNNLEQNMHWADSLTKIAMHSVLANLNIDYSSQFKLVAFPKAAFNSGLQGLSLAGFYNVYSSSFGMNVSKLVANKNGILMGVNSLLENVLVHSKNQNVEINRFTHFSESEDYFFLIEISYSPQSSSNSKQWIELSNVMESFRIL